LGIIKIMSYFQNTTYRSRYCKDEWVQTVYFIQTEWPPNFRNCLSGLDHHLEAKSLAIFSIAKRSIDAAFNLAKAEDNNWRLVFVEASMVLFPMIELLGHARLGLNGNNIGAGIEWLLDPSSPPSGMDKNTLKNDHRIVQSLEQYMEVHTIGPEVRDLFFIRNYFLHGLKSHHDPNISIADILDFELPLAIAKQADFGLKKYWNQLKEDNGSLGWIERLAQSDICPVVIQGSGLFDYGLIDPGIVEYLESTT
jgi:hypothetical protein